MSQSTIEIKADADALRRVLLILIDNAVKYTPEGVVRVQLSSSEGFALMSISDTGIGIGEDDLPHIFYRFWRE